MEMRFRARAKINWSLDVCRLREDGYHELDLLFQSIDWWDTVEMTKKERAISLECDDPSLPTDARNLAFRAAETFAKAVCLEAGAAIRLYKTLPAQAGIGGGSADAAAVLCGMRQMWTPEMTDDELIRIAAGIGADVPCMIHGGLQHGRGIGEKLQKFSDVPVWHLVLIRPEKGLSTREVFIKWDEMRENAVHPDINAVCGAVRAGNTERLCKVLGNGLQPPSEVLYPAISAAREDLLNCGASGALMTGSGSAVFGVFEESKAAKLAAEKLAPAYPVSVAVDTADRGIEAF